MCTRTTCLEPCAILAAGGRQGCLPRHPHATDRSQIEQWKGVADVVNVRVIVNRGTRQGEIRKPLRHLPSPGNTTGHATGHMALLSGVLATRMHISDGDASDTAVTMPLLRRCGSTPSIVLSEERVGAGLVTAATTMLDGRVAAATHGTWIDGTRRIRQLEPRPKARHASATQRWALPAEAAPPASVWAALAPAAPPGCCRMAPLLTEDRHAPPLTDESHAPDTALQ